ncbi:hypothetical protein NEOLEDRAFT_1158607 [Neolentinus lepideus HHB14362 ss-1]|uniref:Uncharacterized protein n=1 Tax=Neolentinus lepideus HHB14362 ss-1 TaxID=1314782 RepID=A0A165P679_9AGAM|nr:hypothetical protein NEOLEDRAFT_1158607 [Neolentinus lepideus HHB14362 ss-1]
MNGFRCTCQRTFNLREALSRHQRTCELHHTHQTRLLNAARQKRDVDAEGNPVSRKRCKQLAAAVLQGCAESSGVSGAMAGSMGISSSQFTRTGRNAFGLLREYCGDVPKADPEDEIPLEDLQASGSRDAPMTPSAKSTMGELSPYGPYPNLSSMMLGNWFWSSGPSKTKADLSRLTKDVLESPYFNTEDLRAANWDKIDSQLSADHNQFFDSSDGWIKASVSIKVPSGDRSVPPHDFVVENLYHRRLVEVIRSVCEDPSSEKFQYTPYRLIWQPPFLGEPEENVHSELYFSQAYLQAHRELHESPREPGCDRPRAIIAHMFWSDSTQLTDFSSASLWPVYNLFGNQSKYTRGRPRANACHHVAYLPKLPDSIQDFIRSTSGKSSSAQLLTHCRRELIHAIWKLLLDDEFRHAYQHGIVVGCADGIQRRLYPRIFTYSADYPEKVLLATLRDKGNCPCPRCLVLKNEIPALGQHLDMQRRNQRARKANGEWRRKVEMARGFIYEQGYRVNSKAIERVLQPESLVPTVNAFDSRVVVDELHEWELGVWKNLLIHLIRILHAAKEDRISEFNTRFRHISSFGRDVIRRFGSNVADLKQFAAREYEDVLQCIIPVFDGLLPEPHNSMILDLLFLMAYTHAMVKLRMHTDSSLDILEKITTELGKAMRQFERVACPAYNTVELPKEAAARARRESTQIQPQANKDSTSRPPGTVRKVRGKKYNLSTYKAHAIGDYANTIRMFGTTDSYTTQIGEQEHRRSKNRYERTSKKEYTQQLANIERRETRLNQLTHGLRQAGLDIGHKFQYEDPDVNDGPPEVHYIIARSQKEYFVLGTWLRQHVADPAAKDFRPKLISHLLTRIAELDTADSEPIFTADEQRRVTIKDERIYSHKRLRVNYTTYNVRRDYDIIAPQRDVMVLAREDDATVHHSFWYARVFGIYHANVILLDSNGRGVPRRMDFLHVRWFGRDLSLEGGWKTRHLDRVGFVPESDSDAFGFLDPAIIRGCHLIPAFSQARTSRLLGHSKLAQPQSEEDDWDTYYVNRHLAYGQATSLYPSTAFAIPYANPEEAEDTARMPDNDSAEGRSAIHPAMDNSDSDQVAEFNGIESSEHDEDSELENLDFEDQQGDGDSAEGGYASL